MNKENYLTRRLLENNRRNLGIIIGKLNNYIELVNLCKKDLKSNEAKEAYKRIIDYKESLINEGKLLSQKKEKLQRYMVKHHTECNHEFILKYYMYSRNYCPFCTVSFNENNINLKDRFVIDEKKLNCNKVSKKDFIFEILDYLVENDLDLTKKEFLRVMNIFNPEAIYEENNVNVLKKGTM